MKCIFTIFPEEQFGMLFALSLVPIAAGQFLITPLLNSILGGNDIAEANFVPVSIGLAVLCAFCFAMVGYISYLSRQKEKSSAIANRNFEDAEINSPEDIT